MATLSDALNAGASALDAIDALRAEAGAEKKVFVASKPDPSLRGRLDASLEGALSDLDEAVTKESRKQAKSRLLESALTACPDIDPHVLGASVDAIVKQRTRARILDGMRPDGRHWDVIRDIESLTSILPACHGSSLFTRGNTQALVSATLGGPREAQDIETLDGLPKVILHYNFPGYSVGERDGQVRRSWRLVMVRWLDAPSLESCLQMRRGHTHRVVSDTESMILRPWHLSWRLCPPRCWRATESTGGRHCDGSCQRGRSYRHSE